MAAEADRAMRMRKHTACDECRSRKVKCSGEQNGCARCRREGISCRFSDQKTMGRPRKRPRKSDHNEHERGSGATDNGLQDTNQASARGIDVSNGRLNASTAHPSRSISRSAIDTSAWDHAHNLEPSLDMTDGLDAVQDLDRNGHEQSGALQTSIAMDGEENSIAHAEPTSGTLSSINGIDLIGVSCSCLNDLYTTLMSFQSLPSPSFPSSRGSLTKATNLARSVVRCPFCPQDYPSALQNLMLLSTLLPLVAHGYAQLLTHIQERADKGTRVTYRVGDLSQSASHLHTDTWDCPMGFNVELESHEWAAMARKVVKQDVYGNGQSMDCLLSVIEELEQRQHIWHLLQPFGPDTSCPNHRRSGNCEHDALCLQLAGRTRIAIEALNL